MEISGGRFNTGKMATVGGNHDLVTITIDTAFS